MAAAVLESLREAPEYVFLSFRVGTLRMAQPVERLREILRYRPAQPVPNAPPFIEGLIELRGELIPVLDLRKRFGVPADVTRQTRIVVTWIQQYSAGLVVDEAHALLRVVLPQIQPVPPLPDTALADLIVGALLDGDQIVLLPDLDLLFQPHERRLWVEFQPTPGMSPPAEPFDRPA
ncbi:MAG: chemotaxis protein CheW [Acidobacteria bacterium]|nr:chemotaxis protein CheW [Acidobacteriota bacterium]MDW7984384.1 chemotaxis protein CheW [Acidobacteriota bacterium]